MDDEESFSDLEKVDTEDGTSEAFQELPKLAGTITDMTMCAIYPLLALATDTGVISIYNWISKEMICSYSYSLSATTIIWPNEKLDGVGASVIVGFSDGTLRWLNLVKEDEKQTREQNLDLQGKEKKVTVEEREKVTQDEDESKVSEGNPEENLDMNVNKKQDISSSYQLLYERSDKEQDDSSKNLQDKDSQQTHEQIADDEKEDEVYNLKLQAITKPHTCKVCCLGVNEESLLLVSQGLDSKLFFFYLKDFTFIPLGFYINNHLVDSFGWLNYGSDNENNQNTKRLLMFCKHSYMLEVDIPNIFSNEADDYRLSFCIEKFNCQLYKINGLLKYHELGDRISDINLGEIPDVGRDVLINLKYEEKKKKREAKEQELDICGPPVPPKILCHLPSKFPGRIWLSLGKNDSGYLFEFQFIKEYQNHPIEFIPCRAVEIITSNFVPVISMNFSFCGKYLYMGLEDGTLHYCHLQEPFDPLSSYGFEKLKAPDPSISRVDKAYASPDGSLLTRCGDDSNRVEFSLNMVGHKDIIEYEALPSFSSESSKGVYEEISGEELPSLEENLQSVLSKKYNHKRESIIEKLEEVKVRYRSFKEEYDAYLKECQSSLKYLETIPGELQLNTEVVSCCPKAVKLFKDKTKALKKELDKEYERDLVKTSLIKQKYLECFKSRIVHEKFFVEESDRKVQSYRECIMPAFAKNLPTKYQQVYGKKVEKKENLEQLSTSKPDTNKKNKKTDKLKQRLTSIMKDIIEYPEDGPVSNVVLKYNKRKQDLAERLKQRIATEEALENIVSDENTYKSTAEEIQKFLYKFKATMGYDCVFPSIKCTYPEKKEKTLAYLNMLHNFQDLFNSFVTDLQSLKNSIHHPDIPVKKKLFAPTGETLDLKKIHISAGDKNVQMEKRYIKIDWNAKGKQESNIQVKFRKNDDFRSQWIKKMFKNFHQLLQAIKPKIDCEKKFIEIRFLMKCIELNLWKPTLSDEKLCVQILEELQEMLSVEEKDLSSSGKEIDSLKNLRKEHKEKWMNFYHDLVKIIGRNHKHKGYLKQIFKKKIYPNEEKRSQIRHSSSESSESGQNIDSDDDNQSVDISAIDEELLKRVMQLRLKRQEVEQKMKEYKRKIRSVSVKQNAVKRKIQKIIDAMNETYENLNLILDFRKQTCDTLTWPLVLYPGNIHSDYIYNPSSNLGEQKQLLEHEMSRIYGIVNEKLIAVNNYVRVSLLSLTSQVVSMEIQDMIDTALVFFPLVQSISISTDEYFESLRHTESVKSLKSDSGAEESSTFIEDILATVEEPVPSSETSLHSVSQKESDLSSQKISSGKETTSSVLTSAKGSGVLFDLEELKGEDYEVKEKEDLRSWHEVCSDIDLLGLEDKSHLQSQDIYGIISSAIPQKASEKMSMDSSNDDVDYYRRPFTYHPIESVQKRCYTEPVGTSETDLKPNRASDDQQNESEPDYPTFPHGGLLLNISVLKGMEKLDLDSYPYTDFYQEIEFHEELTAVPVAVHIEPVRTLDMDILYNFIPVSFSDFILVNTNDIGHILKFYSHLKASSKELDQELKSLPNRVMSTKRALSYKQQDLVKERRELYGAMKSTFNQAIDLELLQDTIENPLFHIKKAEFKTELDNMKDKLTKLKESEALTQRALDQLRFEDTRICYELLELRKEFKFLDESYSKCQVLPRIGIIKRPEEGSQSAENM